MPQVPVFEKLKVLFGVLDGKDVNTPLLREQSSKLLKMGILLKYVLNYSGIILAPVFIYLFVKYKKISIATLFFFWNLFYLYSTLEKSKVIIFLILCCFSLFAALKKNEKYSKIGFVLKKYFLLGGFLVGALIFLFSSLSQKSTYYYKNLLSISKKNSVLKFEEPAYKFFISDLHRVNDIKNKAFYTVGMDYFLYRAFFVPPEVSYYWYKYYLDVKKNNLGFYGLTLKTRRSSDFLHPANEIGRWAYFKRYPKRYLESVSAYSSMDADIYSRWGIVGLFFLSIIYLVVRLSLSFCLRVDHSLRNLIYLNALFTLSFLAVSASIQATVISQGIIVYMFMPYFLLKKD